MPVRETVTIRFDGDPADFLLAAEAVEQRLESLERQVTQTNQRIAQQQAQQAALYDSTVRRQQEQTQALRNSLEAQRLAFLQIGAHQQTQIRRNNEVLAQNRELNRLAQERLGIEQERLGVQTQLGDQLAQQANQQANVNRIFVSRDRASPLRDQARDADELDRSAARAADTTRRLKDVLMG